MSTKTWADGPQSLHKYRWPHYPSSTFYPHSSKAIVVLLVFVIMASLTEFRVWRTASAVLVESFESLKKLVDSDQRNVRNKNMVSLM